MKTILHITKRSQWEDAQKAGRYEADSLPSQGFIHCSKPDQVVAVANFLFRGQTDLVLLCIDPDKAVPQIRYENLEGGEKLFPHIYGPLNLDAVAAVCRFEPGPDGTFALPDVLLDDGL
jgi:uncharacterized protein (DUF952 family)